MFSSLCSADFVSGAVRRQVCAFILSVAVIGLLCHLMNVMKMSNLITKVRYIFLSLTDFF